MCVSVCFELSNRTCLLPIPSPLRGAVGRMGLPPGAEENDRMFCCAALHLCPWQAALLVLPQPGKKATAATSTKGPQLKLPGSRPQLLEACGAGGPNWGGCPSLGSSLHEILDINPSERFWNSVFNVSANVSSSSEYTFPGPCPLCPVPRVS